VQIGVQTLVISPFGGDPAGSLEATFGPDIRSCSAAHGAWACCPRDRYRGRV